MKDYTPKPCLCGCGELVPKSNHPYRQARYISGHNSRRGKPTEWRFWQKVDKSHPDGCWIWKGACFTNGYGHFTDGGKSMGAHRFSYILTYGPIKDNLLVCHRCDNPMCVNPHHLFLGTQEDNMRDMHKKGRQKTDWEDHEGERNPASKLTSAQVKEIRALYASGKSQAEIRSIYKVSSGTVSNIINRKNWKHI